MQSLATDAVESLLTRNATLMAEVRQLRAALDRIVELCDHADKVSASRTMSVYVHEVREAVRLR